jgi:hypothetical protein
MRAELVAADPFTELVAHFLAHVPAPGPGCLFDQAYVSWSDRVSSHRLASLVHETADLLGDCWRQDRDLDELHGFVDLHTDLGTFSNCATRALADLSPSEVSDQRILNRLTIRASPALKNAAELLYASLGAARADFEAVFETHIREERSREVTRLHARWASQDLAPAPKPLPIHVVHALGAHGRALEGRVLIGVAAPWNEVDDWVPLVVALHEQFVRDTPGDDYFANEWSALVRLARAMVGQAGALRDAHVDWLASLDLSDILSYGTGSGQLTHEDALIATNDPMQRAEVFSRSQP